MSFGFSIDDAITLAQFTRQVYNRWNRACGDYADVTGDLAVLQDVLGQVETEAQSPTSTLTTSSDLRGLPTVLKNCKSVVTELETIVRKYKSLGTSRQRNWDRLRMAHTNLDKIDKRLRKSTASLSAYLSLFGIRRQGRVENVVLPEILRRMDDMAAQRRKGASTINSIMTMTTHDGDDKALWREFRRDLIRKGCRGRDLKLYSAALQKYLGQLESDGLLEEPEPELYSPLSHSNHTLVTRDPPSQSPNALGKRRVPSAHDAKVEAEKSPLSVIRSSSHISSQESTSPRLRSRNSPAQSYQPQDTEETSFYPSSAPIFPNSSGLRPPPDSIVTIQDSPTKERLVHCESSKKPRHLISIGPATEEPCLVKEVSDDNSHKPHNAPTIYPSSHENVETHTGHLHPAFAMNKTVLAPSQNPQMVAKDLSQAPSRIAREKHAYAEKQHDSQAAKELIAILREEQRRKLEVILHNRLRDFGVKEERIAALAAWR